MKADIEDFKTGWYGITLGLNDAEIDQLINTLVALKKEKTHFHFRSEFKGEGGIGDIELYHSQGDDTDLTIGSSCGQYQK